jgi:hypothetical protein
VARFSQLAESLRDPRPDVSDAIAASLSAHCDTDRTLKIAELHERSADTRQIANRLVGAFGVAMAPSCVAVLEDATQQAKARSLTALMCEHSQVFAPVLVTRLGQCGVPAMRAIVRVLGFAGTGHEAPIAEQLGSRDEQTVREALRALARIGTPRAASLITHQLEHADARLRGAAEEALWHLTPARTAEQLRDLLGRHDFVQRHPQLVSRLLDRAAQAGATGLDQVLQGLETYRFRFWNPALVRIARRARELRAR